MCSAKVVAVEKKESDDEDDSFERVDRIESSEADDDNEIELLKTALAKAKLETHQLLRVQERNWRARMNSYTLFLVVVIVMCAYYSAARVTPAASCPTPPSECPAPAPPTSCPPVNECPSPPPAPECPPAPKCPKNTDHRRSIRFPYEYKDNGHHKPIPFNIGFHDGFITEVVPGSNAEQAGFEVGDQILIVNGRDLENATDELIYKSLCDYDVLHPIYPSVYEYRSRTGYKPEHCPRGMRKWLSTYKEAAHKELHIEVRKNVPGYVKAQQDRLYSTGRKDGVWLAATVVAVVLFCCRLVKKIRKACTNETVSYERGQVDAQVNETKENNGEGEDSNEDDKEDVGTTEAQEFRAWALKKLKAQEKRLLAIRLAQERQKKKRECAAKIRREKELTKNYKYSWENGTWQNGTIHLDC